MTLGSKGEGPGKTLHTYDRRSSVRRDEQRRRSKRIQITAGARVRYFVSENEYEGILVDISEVGMRIEAKNAPSVNSSIHIYIEQLGRIRGLVISSTNGGFGVEVHFNGSTLHRLREWLDELVHARLGQNRGAERRNFDRRCNASNIMTLGEIFAERIDGSKIQCALAKLSMNGVEILTEAEFAIGEVVRINGTESTVIQKTCNGYQVCHQKN